MQLPYPIRTLGQALVGRISLRVRSGLNRGRRWSLASAGRGYASGTFGRERLQVLAALVEPGDTVWDLGAHKGFVTLAAAGLVGPGGRVVAVEPAGVNLTFLRRHLRWNDVGNVTVVHAAVSDVPGVAPFGGTGDSLAFRLPQGPQRVDEPQAAAAPGSVEVTTWAQLETAHGAPRPRVVKMDVEGEEAAVLRGAGDHLPLDLALLISVHGPEAYQACRQVLEPRGFRILESADMAGESKNPGAAWWSDHDLLAVGPDAEVPDGLGRLPLFTGV